MPSDTERLLRRHGPQGPDAPLPFFAARAGGAWVEDASGRRLLDFSCGASAPLGYGHPDVIRAVSGAGHQPAANAFEWPVQAELMYKLAELTPGGMNRRVLLADSGREALAQAISLAQAVTGRPQVQRLADLKDSSFTISPDTAALVVHPLDPRMGRARQTCATVGTLMIADETGIGPGITGRVFAIEHSEVRPDLYVLGRGWAAGLPFGACITGSSKLHWKNPTRGGDPAACAAALELIRLLGSGLLDRAAQLGVVLDSGLARPGSAEGTVRAIGRGLFWSIILPSGRTQADSFVARCARAGLLLLKTGPSTVGVRPPLIVDDSDVAAAVNIINGVLAEFD